MGSESFPELRGEPPEIQQSFDFESAGEPAYDTVPVIPRALCAFPDGTYDNRDLRKEGDGLFYDQEGNAFEKEEGGRVEMFKLNTTAEFLSLQKSIQAANPSFNPDYVTELVRMEIAKRRRRTAHSGGNGKSDGKKQ